MEGFIAPIAQDAAWSAGVGEEFAPVELFVLTVCGNLNYNLGMRIRKKKTCKCGKLICHTAITCRSCRVASPSTREKMRTTKLGDKNPMWRGDDVGYSALHDWAKRHKHKPDLCECCQKTTTYLDIANKSGKYLRDLTDWEYLCRSCHMAKDGRIKTLLEMPPLKGENNPSAKLAGDEVIEIRRLSASGLHPKDIALRFDISISHVRNILNKRTWKHV